MLITLKLMSRKVKIETNILGACHVVFKELQKAQTIYEKGLKLDPSNQEL